MIYRTILGEMRTHMFTKRVYFMHSGSLEAEIEESKCGFISKKKTIIINVCGAEQWNTII